MTLGQVYDLDLKKNETLIKDVIIQAQGEMALEEFMKDVRPCIRDRVLEKLIDISNAGSRNVDELYAGFSELSEQMPPHSVNITHLLDTSVIANTIFGSGWDDLFTKCSENLNSLVAMKLSPYYKGDQYLRRVDELV